MAGQKAHFYYFVFLAGSLCCVFGSNENDYDHLGKVISDRSKEYYEYEWRNEVHGEVDNAFEQPGDNPADLKPVQENKMDDKKSTENAAAQSQNQRMAMQPESPKPIQNEYHDLLKNWRTLLVSEEFDATNVAAVKFVNKLSEEAESLYRNLDKNQDREYLWQTEVGDTRSADMTTQFRKLLKLATAYGTKGTKYYKDLKILSAVKNGLDFMVKSRKYDGEEYFGNWWDWQVGVPQNFIDIIMIINDELPMEKIQSFTNAIINYVPNPYSLWYTFDQETNIHVNHSTYYNASGSQKAELARTLLGLGILQENKTKLLESLDSARELLKIVTKGNAFYQDGSFVHHHNVPYTGLFGNVLVKKLGEILVIIKGSKYEMARDAVESFIDCVERAFVPLIYQGQMIAPVNGLAISRSPLATQFRNQVATMYNLLVIAQFASTGTENKLKEAVKYWMRQNPNYYLSNTRNYNELLMTISLLNDSAIKGDQLPFVGTKMYASMDRFVQQTPKYMLALSLYSKRISAYEAGNKENKRGWHTADGAMYLYNYDNLQFGDSYWPTVDPYRLPGTTVDTRYLNDEVADYSDFMSNEEWVGGVANSNQAVVGMALNKEGFKSNWRPLAMDLKGKKSWFIVEGQIIALGAGITGSTEATIETIVENRLLGDLYGNKVLSNSQEITSTSAGIDADWLLLESGNNNLSIGYYFPDGENVDVIYDARSGNYIYINEATPGVDYYGRYAKFIINHGQSPVDAKYAYVILPGIKQDELKEYVESQPVQILENSAQIQAVQLINEGYLGINVWSETGGTIEGISSDMPVSLMRQTHDYIDTYVLSDPTQSDRVVTIKIPDFSKVATMSEGVYYDVKNNAFIVDFTNARGASKQFTVYNEVNNSWPYTSVKLDQKDNDMFPDTFDQ